MQRSFVHDGLRFNYYDHDFSDPWSDAPVILMLHAALGNALRFNSWVPYLSRKYRVIRLDQRGHGLSQVPSPDSELSIAVMVKDVLALMDHLQIPRLHIVGNSGGGYVGQHLAMSHPDRVATLALFGSGPGAGTTPVSTWIPQIRSQGLRNFLAESMANRLPPEMMGTSHCENFIDAMANNDVDFACRLYEYMGSQNWTEQLGLIQCPSLIVVPGQGRIGSVDTYRPMLEKIRQCEMLVYAGEYHHVCEYLPERCVTDLLSFLERHKNSY
jgi:pimeloyl-ACP methyl ester carboxylesterase